MAEAVVGLLSGSWGLLTSIRGFVDMLEQSSEDTRVLHVRFQVFRDI